MKKYRKKKYIDAEELKNYIYSLMNSRKKYGQEPCIDLYAIIGHIVLVLESIDSEKLNNAAREYAEYESHEKEGKLFDMAYFGFKNGARFINNSKIDNDII